MILVVGGTGTLGQRVVTRLLDRGESVRVMARHADLPAELHDRGGIEVRCGDVTRREDVVAAVDGVTTIVYAAHGFLTSPAAVDRDGTAHIVEAARRPGADVVLASIVGVAADSSVDLFRMKAAAEQHLTRSGVPWTIVRGTAYLETWIELFEQMAARSGRPLVFGRGRNPVNFVSADDVAALVVEAVTDRSTRGQTLALGGPENLSTVDLAAAVQRAAGRSAPPRHVPRAGLHVMAALMGPFRPALARQARTALMMDTADMTFDPRVTRDAHPGVPATTLAEVLAARSRTRPSAATAGAVLQP